MITFWACALALSVLLYVLLDGFDLGVGILYGFDRDEARRQAMQSAIAPIWDGNETWLVATGVILWGGFPIVYATLLSAFYLPLLVMLAGLILRGAAFEYRDKAAPRGRWIWDAAFAGGSLLAAFAQGVTVGALVEGLPVQNGVYVGNALSWLSPFSVLCGVGLVLGYSLIGACWLIRKCEGEVRELAYRLVPRLSVAIIAVLVAVFVYALAQHLRVMDRWVERPYLLVFPLVALVAAVVLGVGVRHRRDQPPFYMAILVFAAAFGTLAASFWPYMVPFSITIAEAAAPHSSLAFMFWGAGLFVLPLMFVYSAVSYVVFRGKVSSAPRSY